MGQKEIALLHEIIEEAWKSKNVPKDWKTSVIIPIYKKEDRRDWKLQRDIATVYWVQGVRKNTEKTE